MTKSLVPTASFFGFVQYTPRPWGQGFFLFSDIALYSDTFFGGHNTFAMGKALPSPGFEPEARNLNLMKRIHSIASAAIERLCLPWTQLREIGGNCMHDRGDCLRLRSIFRLVAYKPMTMIDSA